VRFQEVTMFRSDELKDEARAKAREVLAGCSFAKNLDPVDLLLRLVELRCFVGAGKGPLAEPIGRGVQESFIELLDFKDEAGNHSDDKQTNSGAAIGKAVSIIMEATGWEWAANPLDLSGQELRGQDAADRMRQFTNSLDPDSARAFLRQAGILDADGNLAEPYRD
jgi:hypothetical protein